MTDPPSILFVGLGNICRSPLAEAALRAEAARVGLAVTVDLAGTGDWHVGGPPDRRAQATALRHGTDISGDRARQAVPEVGPIDIQPVLIPLPLERSEIALRLRRAP